MFLKTEHAENLIITTMSLLLLLILSASSIMLRLACYKNKEIEKPAHGGVRLITKIRINMRIRTL